jgi:mRNA-degrading endonuclease toxin of MazEF toxin-antitoxin module
VVEVATSDGKQTGLLFDSAVQCENIVTVDGQYIKRKIGTFTPVLLERTADCLKAALSIA